MLGLAIFAAVLNCLAPTAPTNNECKFVNLIGCLVRNKPEQGGLFRLIPSIDKAVGAEILREPVEGEVGLVCGHVRRRGMAEEYCGLDNLAAGKCSYLTAYIT